MNKKYIVSMIVVMVIAISAVATKANAFYLGQRGQEVVDIQLTLLESGYDIPALSSGVAKPGYFGTQTQKALTAYEASRTPSFKLGSVTGPDSYFAYTANNDVKTFQFRNRMVNATSTPCSWYIQATSSLDFFSAHISSSTSEVATAYTLATSTVQNATTSWITYFGVSTTTSSVQYKGATTTLAAAAKGTLTYYGANSQSAIINPGTYLTFGGQGGLGTFGDGIQVGGVCQVRYTEI